MNVITGLPRAGTTLLCNILNQNEKFHASSTSGLCELLSVISNKITTMEEITSDLISDPNRQSVLKDSLLSFSDTYHKDKRDKIVFDKSRGWMINNYLLKELYPSAKTIVVVRDPRDVFASVERQHKNSALFNYADNNNDKTLIARADSLFSGQGLIGSAIAGVEDLISRNVEDIFFIKYEEFIKQPEYILRELYKYIDSPYFEHDLNNIENTSTDVDEINRGKFPHKGSGTLSSETKSYEDVINKGFADKIIDRFPLYCSTLGYTK